MPKEFPAKFSEVDKSGTFDKYINFNATCLLIHLLISYHTYYVVLNKAFKYSAWEYDEMRSLTNLQRGGSALKFVGPEPDLGVSRRDIRRRISCWLVNQHWV
jgi:hypothetical protein